MSYQISMANLKQMLKQNLITPKEYAIIETKLAKKYFITLSSIYRRNDLD